MNLLRIDHEKARIARRRALVRGYNQKRRAIYGPFDNERVRAWRKANPERTAVYAATYLEKRRGSARGMWERAKARAKKLGVPFALTPADIHIPEFCPVLGLKLTPARGRGGGHNASPSLDRIIPALGYVPGNVRVISKRANTLKLDATLDELKAVCRWLENELTIVDG